MQACRRLTPQLTIRGPAIPKPNRLVLIYRGRAGHADAACARELAWLGLENFEVVRAG